MARQLGMSERPDLPLAVVVGAGGMAMAIARRLGQHYRLLIGDKNEDHVHRAAAQLRDEGHDAQPVACDIVDPAAVNALKEKAASSGPLRVIAHVVALSPAMGDWQAILTVNLSGARLVADAMLPLASEGTAAIFIASAAAHFARPTAAIDAVLDDPLDPHFPEQLNSELDVPMNSTLAYCLSKYGVVRMCERMASAWGERGARILSLSPGLIATPMGRLEWKHQPVKHQILERTPLSREGTLLEVASATEFLVSNQASFISGIDLLVDGGATSAMRHDADAPHI